MKTKIIVSVIALFAVAVLTVACGNGTNMNAEDISPDLVQSTEHIDTRSTQNIIDKTAELSGAYQFSPDLGKKIMEVTSIADEAVNPAIDNISGLSDVIVRGVTKKVSYIGIEGLARTITSVLVTDVYKGDLQKGDLISVYQLGGYIPLAEQIAYDHDEVRYKDWSKKEINDTVVKEVVNGENFPEKGEDCLYYLNYNTCPVYPDGAFERIAGKDAKLETVTKAGVTYFERNLSESETGNVPTEIYSIKEIKDAL